MIPGNELKLISVSAREKRGSNFTSRMRTSLTMLLDYANLNEEPEHVGIGQAKQFDLTEGK